MTWPKHMEIKKLFLLCYDIIIANSSMHLFFFNKQKKLFIARYIKQYLYKFKVYRGVNKKKEQAAIKVIENSPSKYEEIQNEMSILKRFNNHKNLVGYFGTYLYRNQRGLPTQIWLVIEVKWQCKMFTYCLIS